MKLIKEKRVGDVGEKIGEMAILEAPRLATQIALAYLSRGGSLGYMGASAAGVKYGSLADSGLSDRKRLTNAVGTGSVEALFEMTGTGRIANKVFSGKFKKGAAKKVKELAIDMVGGGVSEGLTQVGENELDKLVGLDADLGGGVAEAFILGALFDGGVSVSGMIGTARKTDRIKSGLVAAGATEIEADAIISKSTEAKTDEAHNEIDKEIKAVLDKNKEENNSEMGKTIAEFRADEILEKETLSEAENTEIDEILEEVDAVTAFEIRKQQEAKNATDTTERDSKDAVIEEDGKGKVEPDLGAEQDKGKPVQTTGQERDGAEQGKVAEPQKPADGKQVVGDPKVTSTEKVPPAASQGATEGQGAAKPSADAQKSIDAIEQEISEQGNNLTKERRKELFKAKDEAESILSERNEKPVTEGETEGIPNIIGVSRKENDAFRKLIGQTQTEKTDHKAQTKSLQEAIDKKMVRKAD
ncbi:unnamed protein product, partial [marine sediment metagenome]